MTDLQFRLLAGAALLVLLYLGGITGITGMGVLIACLVFEGVTNWRLPLASRSRMPGFR